MLSKPIKLYYRDESGTVIAGPNPNLMLNNSKISGECTGLTGSAYECYGSCDSITGDITGIKGDLTGVCGQVTGLEGDLDSCGLTLAQRAESIDIHVLIVSIENKYKNLDENGKEEQIDCVPNIKRIEPLHYYKDGVRYYGAHPALTVTQYSKVYGDCTSVFGIVSESLFGNLTGIVGDISNKTGECTYITGSVSGLVGELTGLSGIVSGLSGDCTRISGCANGVYGEISVTDWGKISEISRNVYWF